MSAKIFRSAAITAMLVLSIGLLLVFSVLFDYFEEQVFSELESEARYIEYGIEHGAAKFLKEFENKNKRITIVSPDGKVIADTAADAESLENHGDRKEIRDASRVGVGRSVRFSDTLTEKTLYYALRLENGEVLRVSTTQNSVAIILLGLLQPIIVIVMIALGVAVFLSYRVANSIIRPINAIDLENPESCEIYEELAPLLRKLSIQKKTISRQIKEAEKSREEFRLICENMNEGFLVTDSEAKVLSYNSAALRLLGVDDEIKDGSVLAFNRTREFREAAEKALGGEHAEATITVKDELTYELIANPVFRNGRVIGSVIVIIDVTESARREQLRREFTANVSHELKTPLTSISGFAEMMKAGGMPENDITEFSASIYAEAQHLIGLVGDIIKLSELDEGTAIFENERVDMYALCDDIAKRLKPTADNKGVDVKVSGESAEVIGARKILDEMIYNLCDNGIKYNKKDGSVELCVKKTEKYINVTVCDTGIGIPENERARVFERFYRVDKSRSKYAGGTGLGLAIVKHGAMYHNAKITLESIEGEGTSVTVMFDCVGAA